MPKILILLLILSLQCAGPFQVLIVECTGNCEMVDKHNCIVKEGGTVSITLDTVTAIETIPGGFILYSYTKGAKFYPDTMYSVFRKD